MQTGVNGIALPGSADSRSSGFGLKASNRRPTGSCTISMRKIVISLILSGISAAPAFAQELHAPLYSSNFGLGDGVVLQETKREDRRSWFKITRNYDYQTDRSGAWGVGQGCFTLCALRQVALERGFSQFTRTFRVLDGSDLRPFRKGEETWDLNPHQFYILTEWSHSDVSADTKKLLEQGSVPANDPALAKFCENWRVKEKGENRPGSIFP